MLTLLGIFIFALAEFLFDYKASAGETNWYIFYFASTYLSIMLVSIDLTYKENSISMKLTSISFAVFYLLLIIMELRFVNVPFDEYIVGVNDSKIRLMAMGLVGIILIYITTTAWVKRRSKK